MASNNELLIFFQQLENSLGENFTDQQNFAHILRAAWTAFFADQAEISVEIVSRIEEPDELKTFPYVVGGLTVAVIMTVAGEYFESEVEKILIAIKPEAQAGSFSRVKLIASLEETEIPKLPLDSESVTQEIYDNREIKNGYDILDTLDSIVNEGFTDKLALRDVLIELFSRWFPQELPQLEWVVVNYYNGAEPEGFEVSHEYEIGLLEVIVSENPETGAKRVILTDESFDD